MQNILFKLNISLLYVTLMLVLSIVSFFIVHCITVPVIWRAVISLFLFIYCGKLCWCDVLRRGKRAVLAFTPLDKREWLVETRGGSTLVQLLDGSVVTSWLLILRFREKNGQSLHCVIFKDALSTLAYRRLSVRLNHAT